MFDSLSTTQPRAKGAAVLSVKRRGKASVIDTLHQSGCMRVLFPRSAGALDAVLINTSGGVTGGDQLAIRATVGQGCDLSLTTQAAERAYRAQPFETGRITTDITVEDEAMLAWLPQELILYDGCDLDRSLNVALAPSAAALVVETVAFGRTAMGETLDSIRFRDRISIHRNSRPIYLDGVLFAGNGSEKLARGAVAQGANAMASIVYAAPDAEGHLGAVRSHLPQFGGASLLAKGLLVVRIVARDTYVLRQSLIPILERLSKAPLPKSWRL